MNDNTQASAVLTNAINNLNTGDIYDLARGLMLSPLDARQLLDLLFDALDARKKQSQQERDSKTTE